VHFPQKFRLKDKRMAENQENPDSDPIEQQLEVYSRNRQKELEGEPIKLDEATRTMLQGEVERVYSKEHPEVSKPAASGIPTWLPWVTGGAVCALALVAALDFNSELKVNQTELARVDLESSKLIPAQEDLKFKGSDINSERATASSTADASSSIDKKSDGAPASIESKKIFPLQPEPLNRSLNMPKAMAYKAPTRSVVRYNNLEDMAQNFAQEPAEKSNLKAKQLPEPILVDFQIERTGNLVKVRDRDGSIYTGNVINQEKFAAPLASKLSAANSAPARKRATTEKVGGLAPGALTPAGSSISASKKRSGDVSVATVPIEGQFFFRVQGTNQTLRKLVVFEATLDGMPDQANRWQYQRALQQQLRSRQAKLEIKSKSIKQPEGSSKKAGARRVQAVQLLRVQGNARVGDINYPLDARQTSSGTYRSSVNSKTDTPASGK